MAARYPWHFAADPTTRLELTIQPTLENAFAGYGFIEVGGDWKNGVFWPFSLNFDVIAHEWGISWFTARSALPDPLLSQG